MHVTFNELLLVTSKTVLNAPENVLKIYNVASKNTTKFTIVYVNTFRLAGFFLIVYIFSLDRTYGHEYSKVIFYLEALLSTRNLKLLK